MSEDKRVIEQIRKNYQAIERLAEEKLDLAKKIYNYAELNLSKIHSKIKDMQKQRDEEPPHDNNESSGRREDVYET